jgi:hypothetical protein
MKDDVGYYPNVLLQRGRLSLCDTGSCTVHETVTETVGLRTDRRIENEHRGWVPVENKCTAEIPNSEEKKTHL